MGLGGWIFMEIRRCDKVGLWKGIRKGSVNRVKKLGWWGAHVLKCGSQLDQRFADNDQILEMALLNLQQEANKGKGRIEALKVLSRALEANPSSVVLWVVYLHIYYSSVNSIGQGDIFRHADSSTLRFSSGVPDVKTCLRALSSMHHLKLTDSG
ncbi:hypothetical protein U1Q18_022139 [Sarracenia purpurea var. burkii]